ncbi:hypothetical protein HOLleu_19959 [Holothuria leucospilota]|uniref:Uncharacterized protein n=1 Tax=Holothuria leucospilota TaxID=206669 RepID=A0A9Q1H858_HOLLE|nr:hypothetical protein HOLleu_19959 [Holothuria leucospilota]
MPLLSTVTLQSINDLSFFSRLSNPLLYLVGGTSCTRKWIDNKRGGGHKENYPDYLQDDEKRAMLQLEDATRKFLAILLKEGRQEKLKSGGPNQNVYGLSSYDYDFQRYF